jgi:hypothetical protein
MSPRRHALSTLEDYLPAPSRQEKPMQNLVSVRPDGACWLVESDTPSFRRSFLSGARAEEAAIQHAEDRAANGEPTEVRLFLRDGSLAGRFLVCSPDHRLRLAS